MYLGRTKCTKCGEVFDIKWSLVRISFVGYLNRCPKCGKLFFAKQIRKHKEELATHKQTKEEQLKELIEKIKL